ncbi:MAG: ArsR family transcriptional regulator [Rhodomicrobium sp.]|nr:MAG: ArsR family transcriptional regulator [Rhodomicrobium sp.]
MSTTLSKDELLSALKAAGDQTRLRLLVLLSRAEHNVKDLTEIMGQSQPRLSRHLKLLTGAGLIERFQEGSWVYYRIARDGAPAALVTKLLTAANPADKTFNKDRQQADKVMAARAGEAQAYFKTHAKDWDSIRSLYIREELVEDEMETLLGDTQVEKLIDLGTGTGRILERFHHLFKTGIGIDINKEMLRHARARLDRLSITSCELRHGDITNLPLEDNLADTVIMHQILHFFAEPKHACIEAARLLKTGGRLLIVDFAPHKQEQLRVNFAHQRLGFSEDQLWQFLKGTGLKGLAFKRLPSTTTQENALDVSLWLASK